MIKVNLLKSYAPVTSESIQLEGETAPQTSAFLKNLVVMALGVGALFAHESINIPALTSQHKAIMAELTAATNFNKQMGPLKKEIEKYEKDLERLNTQVDFLNRVQKERMLPVELINRIRFSVPEKVWLTSLQVAGSSIDLKGEAESTSDVNELNARLAGEPYLKDVVIVSSSLKTTPKIALQNFNIKASYADIKKASDMEDAENSSEEMPAEGVTQ